MTKIHDSESRDHCLGYNEILYRKVLESVYTGEFFSVNNRKKKEHTVFSLFLFLSFFFFVIFPYFIFSFHLKHSP